MSRILDVSANVCMVVALFFLLLSTLVCRADGDEAVPSVGIPADIRARLEANAKALNPITLVWTEQRRTALSEEQLSGKTKITPDPGFLEQSSWVFMWQDKKCYLSKVAKNVVTSDGDTKRSIQERSFDGSVHCAGHGLGYEDAATPGMGIYPLEQMLTRYPLQNVFFQRYTMKFGYKFPNVGRELGMPQQSYILFLNDTGKLIKAEKQIINGKNIFQVTLEGFDTWEQRDRLFVFSLVPEYGYAVSDCVIKTLDDKVAYSIKNEQFEKIPNKEVYIPRKTVVQCFTDVTIPDDISPTPLFTEEYLLTEVATKKVDDKKFDLRKKYTRPGTHIGDRTLDDTEYGVQYVIPANPADINRAIEAARTGQRFVPTPLPSPPFVYRWGLAIIGLCLIIYALWRLGRKSN